MSAEQSHAVFRRIIDYFELWKHDDSADGYNVAADQLAALIVNHTPSTKYYFDDSGRPFQVQCSTIDKGPSI